MDTIVFAGSANQTLATAYAQNHNYSIGKSKIDHFANSEIKVTIQEVVAESHCIVVQSIANPANDRLMELAFTVDALKRQGAAEVSLFIPYFGYARQNIQHMPGECVSAHVVIQLLESLGVHDVTTIELHDEATAGVFSIPFATKTALPLLASEMKKVIDPKTALVASPDQGGIERARTFANAFYEGMETPELITVEKKRNLEGIHESRAVELYGDVKGKTVILVDDVATSGGTILHAAELCLSKGATAVYAAVVHPDFAQGVPQKIQESPIVKWYTTNTIEDNHEALKTYSKFVSVSVAPLL